MDCGGRSWADLLGLVVGGSAVAGPRLVGGTGLGPWKYLPVMVNDKDNGGVSRLSTEKVKVSPVYYAGRILRTVLLGVGAIVLILALVYSCVLVPTSMRYVSTEEFGMVLTKDPTIKRGGIPAGKVELVTLGEDRGWVDSPGAKMNAAFHHHSNVSSMAVLAGPNGRLLTNKKGEMVINGQTIKGSTMPVNYDQLKAKKWYLSDQYVALCLQGACERGKTYIIPETVVLGEVKTEVTGEYEELVDEAVAVQEEMFRKTKPLNETADTAQDTDGQEASSGSRDDSPGSPTSAE